MSSELKDFIKDATRAGKGREEIESVLREAGWSSEDLAKAWMGFYNKAFPVAIPMPTRYASPRLTALNAFYFIVLYIAIWSALAIIFTFLDYHLPDGLGRKAGMFYSSHQSIEQQIRSSLASLLVTLPLVVFSKRLVDRHMARLQQYIPGIRLKLLNLTLLIGSLVLLCNFIGFVYYFLSGELSLRFMIKVAILSGLCGGLYTYFKPEIIKSEGISG